MTKEQRKLVRVTVEERRVVASRTGTAYVTIPKETPPEIIDGLVRQLMEDRKFMWIDSPTDDFFATRETAVHEVESVPPGFVIWGYSFGCTVLDECHRHSEETGKEAAHG